MLLERRERKLATVAFDHIHPPCTSGATLAAPDLSARGITPSGATEMDEGRPLRLSRGILRCTGEAICTGATDYHTGIRTTVASVDSVKSITM